MAHPQIPDDPTLSGSRPIRLYKTDEDILLEIHEALRKNTKFGLNDLIRDAVRAGLPSVIERWKPMIEKSKK